MKLRLSSQQLRFRVSKIELETLLQGEDLSLKLTLPNHTYSYILALAPESESLATNIPLQFTNSPQEFRLFIDRNALKALAHQLPSRSGIRHLFTLANTTLEILFEVDIRHPQTHLQTAS